jgi:hypothetical protein
MWSLTRAVRAGVAGAIVVGVLGLAAPALATGVVPTTPPPNYRWMDGNGSAVSQYDTFVPHTFSLRCDVTSPTGYPNYLKASWTDPLGNSYKFTLHTLDDSNCFYQTAPTLMCDQLVFDCFDTIIGHGTGDLETRGPSGAINPLLPNCNDCGQIEFRFTDNGPAKTGDPLQTPPFDGGEFTISDLTAGNGILAACADCLLAKADYRAHQRGTCAQS